MPSEFPYATFAASGSVVMQQSYFEMARDQRKSPISLLDPITPIHEVVCHHNLLKYCRILICKCAHHGKLYDRIFEIIRNDAGH
jgi:hypothetical protein